MDFENNNEALMETYYAQTANCAGPVHDDSHVDYDDEFHVDKHHDETWYDD